MSQQYQQIKIPQGQVYGEIPLDTGKFYFANEFPKIIYIDRNSHPNENPTLGIKFLPLGAKTATYPQVVLYFKTNTYHLEDYLYAKKDPKTWSTKFECHIKLIDILHLAYYCTKAYYEIPNYYNLQQRFTQRKNFV